MIDAVHEPESLAEALALLRELGDEARPLAGGQSLLVLLRHGLLDTRHLIALWRIAELRGIEPVDGGLRVGAMVTQRTLESAPPVAASYAALRDAAAAVANQQVRNKGTLGGNLCHADPTADPPAALIALDAQVELAGGAGARRLAVESLFATYLSVALRPGELLRAIQLPPPGARTGSAYLKHSLRAVDAAIVGVAAWVQLDEQGRCRDARIGLAGAGLTPLRAPRAEAVLRGARLDERALRDAGACASEECAPLDDLEASARYRRRMVQVYVGRAVWLAAQRAQAASDRAQQAAEQSDA